MFNCSKIKSILLIAIFLLFNKVFSQKNLEKGNRYFNQNQFENAIKYYLMDVNSKNKKAAEKSMIKLADSYRIIGEFEKAEEVYRKILKRKKKEAVNYLNYALSLKSSAKYAEAKLQFTEYVKLKPEDLMGDIYIRSCDSAQLWLDQTIGKEVKNVEKINTEFSEFSPFIFNNKLFFSSSRKGSTHALISFDGGSEVNRLDIYNIDFNAIEEKGNEKTQIVNFKEINSAMHEGAICFTKDGTEVYITKTIKGKRNEKTNDILNTLQIFYSKIDSLGHWSKPKSAFTFNSNKYSIGHPSLSSDGNKIYYMSDMPGGFGKTDIYYSTKQSSGIWSKPINVGNSINTFGYEMFPNISESGVLYFSSNAHPGMGQLDIFNSFFIDGKWTNVTNSKPPINSIGNDFGIFFDGVNSRGFFSSDRFNGKGAEDIYSFADDLPLTLSFLNDTLTFVDKSIFDEIKYKIVNENDKSETNLNSESSVYKIILNQLIPYKLVARKNGMPYNKIFIIYEKLGDLIDLKIKTSAKTILINGDFNFYKKSDLTETIVLVKDTSGSVKKYALNSFSNSGLNDTLKNNFDYQISTKIKSIKKIEAYADETLDKNILHLKIKIKSNNVLKNVSITVKDDEKVITKINSGTNNEFNCYLKYSFPQKYVIILLSNDEVIKTTEFEIIKDEFNNELSIEIP